MEALLGSLPGGEKAGEDSDEDERGAEGVDSTPLRFLLEENGQAESQSRHLRQGQINKDDLASGTRRW